MSLSRQAEQEAFAGSLHSLMSAADVTAAARRWADQDHSAGLALWLRLDLPDGPAVNQCLGLLRRATTVARLCESTPRLALTPPR